MSRRTERLNNLLRERLSELLQRELKDPRVRGLVTITAVEVSVDLRTARVYVSVLGTQAERAANLQGLRSAAGFLHRGLETLSLRRVPELTFVSDDSMERGDHLLRIMGRIQEGTDSGSGSGEAP
ncbi:MAG: 30S ribosome-binding factor RbfA [Chloroflexi bacterium]|nr:30S ribosome-binding factor RbfA [Chloroflexota bacterium]